jgi:hypothetical protein
MSKEQQSLKIPNVENAIVEDSKILGYLLNFSHPDGWSKAKFFGELGFNQSNWKELSNKLIEHARDNEVLLAQETFFGYKYLVEGDFYSLVGKPYKLRAIWFIVYNEITPKLVTAYPVNL